MTIPLVSLADHLGYRPVLCLSLVPRVFVLLWTFAVGYFDSILPVKAIIAAPAFSFLGGDCVVNSIVYAIASELAGDDHVLRYVLLWIDVRKERRTDTYGSATFFGWINATSSVFALQLGPALASATMTVLLWLPLWIGVGLLIMAIPVISALPLPPTPRCHQRDRLATDEENEAAAPLISSITTPTKTITLKDRAAARFRTLLSLVASPTRNFTLLLAVFFLASLASSDTKMLPLYASTRYRWTFAQVGYLLSTKAVFNFVFLTFVVPRLLRWRWRKVFGEDGPSRDRSPSPTPHRDQTTTPSTGGHRQHPRYARLTKDGLNASHAHTCLVLSVLGALAIALAPTPALLVPALLLYALGIALPMFTYSLLRAPGMGIPIESALSSTSHRDEDGRDPNSSHHTHVFSVVMLIRTVGSLVGAAVMPSLWVMGLGWGGWALGLPFVASAAGYAVAAVLLKRMRV
jgi:MFS family permease